MSKAPLIGGSFGLSVLLVLSLQGCVLPFPTTVQPLPFPEEQLSQIVPGTTSRQEVIELLGVPDFEGVGSSLALYSDERRVAGVFVAAPQQAVGVGPIKSGHVLVVGYGGDGTVRGVDVFRKGVFRRASEVCTASGICIKPHVSTADETFRIVDAKFFDTPENDTDAKALGVPSDRCAIYVYLDTNFWAGERVLVQLTGAAVPQTYLDKSGFYRWHHDPGPVSILVSDRLHSRKPLLPGQEVVSDANFQCLAGNAHIVKATLRWNWGAGKHDLVLSLDDPAVAALALRKRRLLIQY